MNGIIYGHDILIPYWFEDSIETWNWQTPCSVDSYVHSYSLYFFLHVTSFYITNSHHNYSIGKKNYLLSLTFTSSLAFYKYNAIWKLLKYWRYYVGKLFLI